jgi:hypothetical protein
VGKKDSAGASVVLVSTLLAAGCGGSSEPSSAARPATTSSPTNTQTVPGGGAQAELDSFLAELRPIRTRGNASINRMEAAINKTDSSDPAALSTMATEISKAAKGDARESNELAALVPPAALARPWAGYVAGIDTQGRLLTSMADDARRKDAAAINGWNSTVVPELHRTADKTNGFRLALIAYAAKNHLKLPAWAKKIGTGS